MAGGTDMAWNSCFGVLGGLEGGGVGGWEGGMGGGVGWRGRDGWKVLNFTEGDC